MLSWLKKSNKKEKTNNGGSEISTERKEEIVSDRAGSTSVTRIQETVTRREVSSVVTKETFHHATFKAPSVPELTFGTPSANSTRSTIFNTTFPSNTDAYPFTKQLSTNALPTYKSVYTREPFSRYEPRRVSTASLPAPTTSQSASSSSNVLVLPKVVKSSSESGLLKGQKPLKISVKKTGKYFDTSTKVPTYSTRSKSRRALIISNVKFIEEEQYREGAEVDEHNIVKLFKQMGFKTDLHRNKTKSEMERIIATYCKNGSLINSDINVMVVMSHGVGKERSDSTEVVGTDGQLLPTTWILNEFDSENCRYLSGKPKIFIFQCCRGSREDIQIDAHAFKPPVPVRKLSDMLVAYSTVPGFVSHRNPITGTWYIQTICEVFMEHAHDTDVESMLKMVDDKLKRISSSSYSRQTSSFENRGFKNCFLHPI